MVQRILYNRILYNQTCAAKMSTLYLHLVTKKSLRSASALTADLRVREQRALRRLHELRQAARGAQDQGPGVHHGPAQRDHVLAGAASRVEPRCVAFLARFSSV